MNYFKLAGAVIKAHAPEILVATGIAAGVGAVVTAIIATPKAIEAKKEVEEKGKIIVEAHEKGVMANGELYSEKDYKTDLIGHTVKSCWAVGKYYIPTAALVLASGGCSVGALGIMKKRNAAITAAATTAIAAFAKYRENVVAIDGEKKDQLYLTGKVKSKTKDVDCVMQEAVVDENGNVVEEAIVEKISCRFIDGAIDDDMPIDYSPFTIRLDERFLFYQSCQGNPFWMKHYIDGKLKEINRYRAEHKVIDLATVYNMLEIDKSRPEFKDVNMELAKMCLSSMVDKYYDAQNLKWVENKEYDPTGQSEIDIKNIDDIFLTGENETGTKNIYYLDFSGFGFYPGCMAEPPTKRNKRSRR